MIKMRSLYSGSSGNATLISDENSTFLIDMGKNNKQTLLALEQAGVSPHDIDAVLLTHEHADHIAGLKVFTKNRQIPIYGPKASLDYLEDKALVSPTATLKEAEPKGFYIGGFYITPFATQHDSLGSCGFCVEKEGKKVVLATDLGAVTNEVQTALQGANAVLLEANYDPNMLQAGSYPYYLKKRIACDTGHLSNDASADTVVQLAQNGVKEVLLAHLSSENNMPALALETVRFALKKAGLLEQIALDVCPRNTLSKLVIV